jgi:tRNA dimethylallyltransferase
MATEIVAGIRDRGALPLLVGGTGLWISAFLNELPLVHPANPEMLERLEKRLASEGPESLWREMERVDPQSAGRIHRHDRYRILRALAFHETTGGPISAIRRKGSPLFSPVVHCALDLSRPELYDRINKRTEIMFAEGLVAEVATLRSRGLDPALPALKSIGYGTVCEMLDRKIDLARALAVVQQDTRRYAKRQLTWLRAQEGIIRVDARDPALAAERVTSEILRVIGPFPRPAP